MAKNTHIIEVKTQGADKSKKQIQGVSGSLKGMAKSAGVAAAAYFGSQALLGAIKSSIDLFAKQEQAEKKLRFAAGEMTDALIGQAEALQKVTVFGDEQIIGQQAYLASLGLTQSQIEDTISASVDLAAATGMTLESAVLNTSKTLSGMAGELGEKLGPAFRDLTPEALKAGDGIKFIAEQFGGTAQADADSFAGSMAQMSNAVGDTGEAFGSLLAPAVRMGADALSFLANSLTSIINLEETQKARLNDSVMAYTDLQRGLDDYNSAVKNMTMDELIDEFFVLNQVTDEQDKIFLREKALRGELRETIDEMTSSYNDLQIITSTSQETDEYGLTLTDKILEQNEQIIADIDRKSESIQAESEILDEYIKIKELQKEKDEAQILLEDKYILKMREKGEMLDTLTSKEKKQVEAEKQSNKQTLEMIKTIANFVNVEKGAAITSALASTYDAANAEYLKYQKKYPAPTGTILGIAAATAATARGLSNVDKIRKAQYGADFITDGPQMMMVGEGSGPERVQVTPLVDPNIDGPQGQPITLNISGNVLHESFVEDNVIPQIREGLRLGENIGL